MCGIKIISGVSLNGKFDDTVKLDGKDVKANVKKLSDGITLQEAEATLKDSGYNDGYDTIGVSIGKEKYLIQVQETIDESALHHVKLGGSQAKVEFILNE